MWYVTVDSVSVKEIAKIEFELGCDLFNLAGFDSPKEALDFASKVKEISPLALVEVEL
jgi:hypothetical protein